MTGAGLRIPLARYRAVFPPALPWAVAVLLFLAVHAAARAGQVPDRDSADGLSAVPRTRAAATLQERLFASLLTRQGGALAVANPVAGTEFTLTPSVHTTLTLDNNVMFQDVSDQVVQVSPVLEGKLRTERTTLTMRAGADLLRYARYDEFDRMNRDISVGLRHAVTEATGVELRGRARSDHSFESALDEAGEVALKTPHHEYSLQPALAYRLDERTEVRLDGEAVAHRYPERKRNDAQTRGASLGLARTLDGGAATLLARTRFSTASYDTGAQDTTTLGAGMDVKINETLSGMVIAGPALSRDRFPDPRGGETHLGLAGEAGLRLSLERSVTELGGGIGTVTGASGEDILRRRITGRTVVHITDRTDLILAGAWIRSRSRSLVNERYNTMVTISPGLRHALGEYASLNLEYGYTCIDDHVAEVYRQRQQISLSLHLEFPHRLR